MSVQWTLTHFPGSRFSAVEQNANIRSTHLVPLEYAILPGKNSSNPASHSGIVCIKVWVSTLCALRVAGDLFHKLAVTNL